MEEYENETEDHFELPNYKQMDQIWNDFLVSGYVDDDERDSLYISTHDMAIETCNSFLQWYYQRLKEGW